MHFGLRMLFMSCEKDLISYRHRLMVLFFIIEDFPSSALRFFFVFWKRKPCSVRILVYAHKQAKSKLVALDVCVRSRCSLHQLRITLCNVMRCACINGEVDVV